MLDVETKRRIDTARDILVGKVPDPKSQVEQITIALIYKFMDDMDAGSEELGGTRRFFAGEFARFGWPKLMRSGLGGHEMLNLYAEAIGRMPENPGIPVLFRDIFNNAYLPYRDPETLRAFLKIIDEFTYDHSERLGDAFEYLLSVLGSQGDAGQFRTPRHIIDFIVAVLDPKKSETVLDPACGTAGFLISSYKHIIAANTDDEGNSTLTPDERERLTANLQGYDISPDMVRLSLVNMYLHGFPEPHIIEYDTLTSDDRWNEYADVILANPPFMSPKGGIRPHNRFSVKSKRSEVLFVDYMAEHLTPAGRAGIIVPEGIIFQSQNAHKQLRKMLIEEYLVAVVSLPAGVFNPYSGVKTSILILDRALAKRTDRIAFFKVENDGFDLGAQRRPIDKNDLPGTEHAVKEYMDNVGNMDGQDKQDKDKAAPAPRSSMLAELVRQGAALIVGKTKIAAGGEYNLSGERYRESESYNHSKWPLVSLKDVCAEILSGGTPSTKNEDYWKGTIPWITSADIVDIKTATPRKLITEQAIAESATNLIKEGNVIVVTRVGLGKLFRNDFDVCISQDSQGLILKERVNADYLVYVLKDRVVNFKNASQGSTIQGVTKRQLAELQFPLPPLEVQREIVAEIEGYQRVIDGARAVIDNYRPHIPIDPEWPMVELGNPDLFFIESGGTPRSSVEEYWNGDIPWITLVDLPPTDFVTEIVTSRRAITELGLKKSSARLIPENSVIVSTRATIGRIAVNRVPLATNQGFKNIIVKNHNRVVPEYIAFALSKLVPDMVVQATGGTFKEISKSRFSQLRIPLPPLDSQRSLVSEIENEQTLVDANRELIEHFEKKIQTAIGRVWGAAGSSTS